MSADVRGPGPYSKRTMRMLAITGGILDLFVLGFAIKALADGRPGGMMMLAIAVACIAVLAIGVPVARRRGRI